MNPASMKDPLVFAKVMWPDVTFYNKQREMIRSVQHNDETFVVAGNMLGKDFVAGFICLWFFLVHGEVRIITTSVKDDHLRVLWGEIGRYIQTARYPLDADKGGPLVINHRDIRKLITRVRPDGSKYKEICPISYLRGMVSAKGEGMAGHHAAYTLGVIDEASGVDQLVYTQMGTWTRKMLIFGNPNPCPLDHFFYTNTEAGDLEAA